MVVKLGDCWRWDVVACTNFMKGKGGVVNAGRCQDHTTPGCCEREQPGKRTQEGAAATLSCLGTASVVYNREGSIQCSDNLSSGINYMRYVP